MSIAKLRTVSLYAGYCSCFSFLGASMKQLISLLASVISTTGFTAATGRADKEFDRTANYNVLSDGERDAASAALLDAFSQATWSQFFSFRGKS